MRKRALKGMGKISELALSSLASNLAFVCAKFNYNSSEYRTVLNVVFMRKYWKIRRKLTKSYIIIQSNKEILTILPSAEVTHWKVLSKILGIKSKKQSFII